MSALLAPAERTEGASRPALRAVGTRPGSRTAYVVFLATLLAIGMVGVLVLNVKIQERALTVQNAQRQAADLGAQQASLTAQVERLRSSSDLADRAWTMGLRPNPYPVFVKLDADGTGRVLGEPTRVSGGEMPDQKYLGADDVTKRIAQAREQYKAQIARQKAEALARQKAAEAKAKADAAVKAKADAAAKAKADAAAKAKADAAKAEQARTTSAQKSSTGGN